MRLLLKCDLFRTVNDADTHLTPATSYGAGATIVTYIVLAILLTGEIVGYFSGYTQCHVSTGASLSGGTPAIDISRMDRVKAELTLPYMPCSAVDVQLLKEGMYSDEQLTRSMKVEMFTSPQGDFSKPDAPKRYITGEPEAEAMGCTVRVDAPIPPCPSQLFLAMKSYDAGKSKHLPPDHAIHTLIMGSEDIMGRVPQINIDTVQPLAGFSTGKSNHNERHPHFVEHYVQTLKTRIQERNSPAVYGYQYTSNMALVHYSGHGRSPGVYFTITPSEFGFTCTVSYADISHFLVHLCAIVGGVYTVASFVELAVELIMKERLRRERAYRNALNTEISEKTDLMRRLLPAEMGK